MEKTKFVLHMERIFEAMQCPANCMEYNNIRKSEFKGTTSTV